MDRDKTKQVYTRNKDDEDTKRIEIIEEKMDRMDDIAFVTFAGNTLGTAELYDDMKSWFKHCTKDAIESAVNRIEKMEKERDIYVE